LLLLVLLKIKSKSPSSAFQSPNGGSSPFKKGGGKAKGLCSYPFYLAAFFSHPLTTSHPWFTAVKTIPMCSRTIDIILT